MKVKISRLYKILFLLFSSFPSIDFIVLFQALFLMLWVFSCKSTDIDSFGNDYRFSSVEDYAFELSLFELPGYEQTGSKSIYGFVVCTKKSSSYTFKGCVNAYRDDHNNDVFFYFEDLQKIANDNNLDNPTIRAAQQLTFTNSKILYHSINNPQYTPKTEPITTNSRSDQSFNNALQTIKNSLSLSNNNSLIVAPAAVTGLGVGGWFLSSKLFDNKSLTFKNNIKQSSIEDLIIAGNIHRNENFLNTQYDQIIENMPSGRTKLLFQAAKDHSDKFHIQAKEYLVEMYRNPSPTSVHNLSNFYDMALANYENKLKEIDHNFNLEIDKINKNSIKVSSIQPASKSQPFDIFKQQLSRASSYQDLVSQFEITLSKIQSNYFADSILINNKVYWSNLPISLPVKDIVNVFRDSFLVNNRVYWSYLEASRNCQIQHLKLAFLKKRTEFSGGSEYLKSIRKLENLVKQSDRKFIAREKILTNFLNRQKSRNINRALRRTHKNLIYEVQKIKAERHIISFAKRIKKTVVDQHLAPILIFSAVGVGSVMLVTAVGTHVVSNVFQNNYITARLEDGRAHRAKILIGDLPEILNAQSNGEIKSVANVIKSLGIYLKKRAGEEQISQICMPNINQVYSYRNPRSNSYCSYL